MRITINCCILDLSFWAAEQQRTNTKPALRYVILPRELPPLPDFEDSDSDAGDRSKYSVYFVFD